MQGDQEVKNWTFLTRAECDEAKRGCTGSEMQCSRWAVIERVNGGRLRCFTSTTLGYNAAIREIKSYAIVAQHNLNCRRICDDDKINWRLAAESNECGNMYVEYTTIRGTIRGRREVEIVRVGKRIWKLESLCGM